METKMVSEKCKKVWIIQQHLLLQLPQSHISLLLSMLVFYEGQKIYYARCKKHIHAFGNKQGFEKLFLARKDLYATKHYKHFTNCK